MSITDQDGSPAKADEPADEPGKAPARRVPVRVPAGGLPTGRLRGLGLWLALALALTLAGAGVRLWADPSDKDTPPPDRAQTDTAATSKAIGDVGNALTKILTYDYRDPPATQRAADQLLIGTASGQYRALFESVKKEAPRQRLTLTTKVVRAGAISLTGDTARLLFFLDQRQTRAGKAFGGVAPAQLIVTAKLLGGQWRISDLRAS